MILDILIPKRVINSTRAEKLECATTTLFVAAVNGLAAKYGFSQDETSSTVVAIGNTAAMAATTFSGTYALLSAMEPDVSPLDSSDPL